MTNPGEWAASVARGRAKKRANALTAILCGGAPAAALAVHFPSTPLLWAAGFLAGAVWANAFEYFYHRFLLHFPRGLLAARHREHHITVGTPAEAEHVNLGDSPRWIVALFALNGLPVAAAELLLQTGLASGMLAGFVVYFVGVEEMHWRIHGGEWLPPGLRWARAYHLAHHDRADARFNVFLPLFDWLLGPPASIR
jgi:hypothetical protein